MTIFSMSSLDQFGDSGGFEVRVIEDISRIDLRGDYEKRMGALNGVPSETDLNVRIENLKCEDLISELTKICIEEKIILTVWGPDPEYPLTGYVLETKESELKLLSHNKNGREDGISIILAEDIDAMNLNKRENKI